MSKFKGAICAKSLSKSIRSGWSKPGFRSPTWPIVWQRIINSKRWVDSIAVRRSFRCSAIAKRLDPLDLADRVVAVKNDQSIYLRDIGRVVVSHEDRSMAIRCNGEDAVSLTVFRRLGGNALAVSHELNDALAEARKTAPPGIAITPVYDQGQLVRTAIDNVRDAMLIGGAMSVLVLLVFLKSVRATLIAALSIPLSLVISFGFLKLTGDTLNLMSLGGLAVAIGLIIDDTVVVIENIARHLATGQSGDDAVEAASKEISGSGCRFHI